MSRRILFVDDERQILEGLRHRLYAWRHKWDMVFLQSARDALELLAREPIDVVVCDMRMPEIDGMTFLRRVQEEHPEVVRIVLSGHAEIETALRAVHVAHQFLAKPSDAGVIEEVIERACGLQALMNDAVVQRVVGRIDRLPSVPRVYSQVTVAMRQEQVTAQEIARILKQDMAMCAKLLQIVNSAFFRLSRSISKIDEAVAYLGFGTVRQMVLAVEVFQICRPSAQGLISIDELQAHSLLVGQIESELFKDRPRKEDAFVAGLLHDIGKLVMMSELPEHMARVLDEMRSKKCAMTAAERELYGVTHAEIGAYLLGLWGLPYPIIEAVANHHAPGRADARIFDVLAATHIADALVPDPLEGTAEVVPGVDMDFLRKIGVADQLDSWKALAQRQVDAAVRGPPL